MTYDLRSLHSPLHTGEERFHNLVLFFQHLTSSTNVIEHYSGKHHPRYLSLYTQTHHTPPPSPPDVSERPHLLKTLFSSSLLLRPVFVFFVVYIHTLSLSLRVHSQGVLQYRTSLFTLYSGVMSIRFIKVLIELLIPYSTLMKFIPLFYEKKNYL